MRTLADADSEAVPDSAFPFTRGLACGAIALLCAGGAEITMATEAEYDRKVMRVRMRSH